MIGQIGKFLQPSKCVTQLEDFNPINISPSLWPLFGTSKTWKVIVLEIWRLFPVANQGSKYRTGRYVPYRYVYRYRNINVLYWFKYRPYRPCTGHTGQFRAISTDTRRTGQYRKKFLFYFLSFVIFEFLLG